jgi:hypothetical protein
MEYLVAIGEAMDAEDMVPISMAHVMLMEGQVAGPMADMSFDVSAKFLEDVEAFAVPTTLNSTVMSLDRAKEMGISEQTIACVKLTMPRAVESYVKRGAITTFSCTPHSTVAPTFGQHVALTEGGVVIFANSVIGARNNYETVPSALAAAVVGRTPRYGLHLPENRHGQVVVELGATLNAENFTYADYEAAAFYAAGVAEDRIPVWTGLAPMSEAELKYFTIAHCLSGAMALVHIVGVTPEAPTLEAAFGPNKTTGKIVVEKKNIESVYALLTSATKKEIDAVILGCPHLTIDELGELAQLLDGKKIHAEVKFTAGTNQANFQLAERMGLVEIIEKSGAFVTQGACSGTCSIPTTPDNLGVGTLVTNSATCASLVPPFSLGTVGCHYRNMKDCVEAGIMGGVS